MRVLSLFSGGGLGDYGLTLVGMEIVGQVEIDDYCQKILKLRWPDVPKWKDIRGVKGEEIKKICGTIDLISGGFPCQDISTANSNGKGIAGEKSGLWKEMHRIIREIRPRYVLVENVTALLGRGLGTVLGDLAQSGYFAEWDCIPASAFGAPHKRDRIWIVAYTNASRQRWYKWKSQIKKKVVAYPHSTRSQIRWAENNEGMGTIFEEWKISRYDLSEAKKSSLLRNTTIERLPDWAGGKVGQPYPLTEFERSSGEELSHPDKTRLQKTGTKLKTTRIKHSLREREIERVICRIPDGFADWLDQFELPENVKGVLGEFKKNGYEEILSGLRKGVKKETIWRSVGGQDGALEKEVLLAFLCRVEKESQAEYFDVAGKEASEAELRGLRNNEKAGGPPCKRKSKKQRRVEPSNALQRMSQIFTHDSKMAWDAYLKETSQVVSVNVSNRVDRLKLLGNGQVPQVVCWIGERILEYDAKIKNGK